MLKRLDDIKVIERVDKANMRKLLVDFPYQLLEARDIALNFKLPEEYLNGRYKNIVFAGMGGSAIGADLLKDYLKFEIKVPIYVNRDYNLPEFVNEDTLFFGCSYSGNTEETLDAFKLARRKRAKIICLSSDGKLERLAARYNYPFIKIPSGYPPRCALGYSSLPLLIILNKLGLIKSKNSDIKDAHNVLKRIAQRMRPSKKSNYAKRIASEIYGQFTIVYGSSSTTEIPALRFRGQLAENSKTLSSHHIFPEMNHNEIVGWENPKKILKDFVVVILRSKKDHRRIKRRIDISKKIILRSKAKIIEIEAEGSSLLSQMLSLIYVCDWISFYLAILNGVDPTPVKRIEFLKKKLAKD